MSALEHKINIEIFVSKDYTKYVVGASANPPKNPSNPPKKGMHMAMNIVNAVYQEQVSGIVCILSKTMNTL